MSRRGLLSSILLSLSILPAFLSCDSRRDQAVQPPESGWSAAPRIAAGSLTEAQIAMAEVVVVSARMGAEIVASKEIRGARSATLRIPRAGSVDFLLEGWLDSAKTIHLWSGSCVLDPDNPDRVATLEAESGLRVAAPRRISTASSGVDTLSVILATPTEGAEIRYTLDGTDPATSPAAVYQDKILLDTSARIRAVATRPNFLTSEELDESFVVTRSTVVVPPPDSVAKPNAAIQAIRLGDSLLEVVLTSATVGSSIRYTLDDTDPSSSPSATQGLAPLTLSLTTPGNLTLRAIGIRSGMSPSQEFKTSIPVPGRVLPVTAKTIPKGDSVLVVLTCATPQAQIRHTLDGSDPLLAASSFSVYEDTLRIARTSILRSVGVVPGLFAGPSRTDSIVVVATPKPDSAARPEVTILAIPPGDSVLRVVLASATSGATLQYTLDGSDPRSSTSVLEALGPVSLSLATAGSVRVRAVARRVGLATSQDLDRILQVPSRVATPVLSVRTSFDAVRLVLKCATPGASIFYTTDGSDPMGPSALAYKPNDTLRPSASRRLRAVGVIDSLFASRRLSDTVTVLPGWNWTFDADSKDSGFLVSEYAASGSSNPSSSNRIEVSGGALLQTFTLLNDPGSAYSGWTFVNLDWSRHKGPRDLRKGGRISFQIQADTSLNVDVRLISPLQTCGNMGVTLNSKALAVSKVSRSVSLSLGEFILPSWVIGVGDCNTGLVSSVDSTHAKYNDPVNNVASAVTGIAIAVMPRWNATGDRVDSPLGSHTITLDNVQIVP